MLKSLQQGRSAHFISVSEDVHEASGEPAARVSPQGKNYGDSMEEVTPLLTNFVAAPSRLSSLSPPLPLAAAPLRYPLSPPFLFCLVLTWQRRGFCVRSAAAVASTSLPALRDRSVGVQPPLLVKHWGGGGCFQTLG